MLCMGDFNAMLNGNDKLNGSPVQEGEIKDFVEFLADTHMIELKVVDREYTWTKSHTCSRIDQAPVNVEWMVHMSMLEVIILPPWISDHSSLSLELGGEIRRYTDTFIFFNYLAEHPEFIPRVNEAWKIDHKSSLKQVWQNLDRVKTKLKQLNNCPIVQAGGCKYLLFSPHIRNKIAQNSITSLLTVEGAKVHTQEDIEREVTGFYKELLGKLVSCLHSVYVNIMKLGNVLNREKQLLLAQQSLKWR
ncbi:hypothetical protein BC332_21384 [Capsicum chinense]|nr:hypothetical protein BC332_21384 [Capsicum chinense]